MHPDGRLQRLRTAIAHPGSVRAGWSVIAEIARRAGLDTGVLTAPMAFAQLAEAVPVLPRPDARGDRRARGALAGARGGVGLPEPRRRVGHRRDAEGGGRAGRRDTGGARCACAAPAAANGALRLGTYRSIWAAPEVEISPALKFTVARQQVELAPEDAQRLGIAPGEAIEVSQNGTSVEAIAHVRTGVPAGTAFLAEGIPNGSANAFTEPVVEVHKR